MPGSRSAKPSRGPFLIELGLKRDSIPSFDEYPFSLPVIRTLARLQLHPKVTFLMGENGTGKSTLLEAIAVAVGLNPEGGSRYLRFKTRDSHSALHRALRLVRTEQRPRDAFFVRSETLYTLATALEDSELGADPRHYGERSLHERSRGEALMALVLHRLGGGGLYLFDEPEAGLSPTRQLAFLAAMHQLVETGAQLILATHSPILLAYPHAWIYELDESGSRRKKYEDTEHYRIASDFFLHRQAMLDELLAPDDGPSAPAPD